MPTSSRHCRRSRIGANLTLLILRPAGKWTSLLLKIRRTRAQPLPGVCGSTSLELQCALLPEDVLLAKLQWAKLGESERQLQDAGGILRTQGNKFDLPHIERCVRDLHVEEQWQTVREKFS